MPRAKAKKQAPSHCTCPTYGSLGKGPRKPISEITAADIPRGMDIYDIGCACGFWTVEKYEYATRFGEDGLREVLGQRLPDSGAY